MDHEPGSAVPQPRLQLTDDEWRANSTRRSSRCYVRRAPSGHSQASTPDTKTEGIYECRACGAELFRSTEKFESHCGWPSFYDPVPTPTRSSSDLTIRSECAASRCCARTATAIWVTCFSGEGYPDPNGSALLHQFDIADVDTDGPLTAEVGNRSRSSNATGRLKK